MSRKALPAMPKLRPRPDLKPEPSADDFVLDQDLEEEETIPPPSMKRPRLVSDLMSSEVSLVLSKNDSSDTTSRLLTKNDCRGGRKRNSGSLIHSIPKFTQVRGNHIQQCKQWEGIIVPLLRRSLFYFGCAEVDEGTEVDKVSLIYNIHVQMPHPKASVVL